VTTTRPWNSANPEIISRFWSRFSEGLQVRPGARVEAAGTTGNLVQQVVQPRLQTLSRVLFWKLEGVEHCGFTPQQNAYAFRELTAWVRDGVRP